MISKVQQIAQKIGKKLKKCGEHEQTQMEKAGERKKGRSTKKKNKEGNDK